MYFRDVSVQIHLVMIEGSWQLAKKNMVGKDIREEEMSVSWILGKLNQENFSTKFSARSRNHNLIPQIFSY